MGSTGEIEEAKRNVKGFCYSPSSPGGPGIVNYEYVWIFLVKLAKESISRLSSESPELTGKSDTQKHRIEPWKNVSNYLVRSVSCADLLLFRCL